MMPEYSRSYNPVLHPVDLRRIAAGLKEHNEWRRGEGRYAWDGEHPQNAMPFGPKKLGELIDEAVEALEAVAAEREGSHLNLSYWDAKLDKVSADDLASALRIAALLPRVGVVRFHGFLVRRDFDRVRLFKDEREEEA